MEAIPSSETSVYNKPKRRHIPEDDILLGHRRQNLKSCIILHEFHFLLPVLKAQIISGRLFCLASSAMEGQ
jgi:hypothetical protein